MLLIALFALWFVLGVAFGWRARDNRESLSRPVPTTPSRYATIPVYVVHWHREDGSYIATVDGLPGGAVDVEHVDDLYDDVRDVVVTLIGTDRFWLEWRPGLSDFS